MTRALITGASSGIGAALGKRLASDGVEVVLAARRRDALEALASEIQRRGGRATVEVMDVADADATHDAVRRIDDAGALDLVIANAGIGGTRWAGELDWAKCASMIDVNVRGAVATLTAILPRMMERDRGHLVGVTSMAAMRALPHSALYGASKAFLRVFLDGLRLDLTDTGVAVTEVRPGFVRTAMAEALEEGTPTPFMIETDEAADIVARGLARRDGVIAFPWAMARLIDGIRALPSPVFDRAARRVRPDPRQR